MLSQLPLQCKIHQLPCPYPGMEDLEDSTVGDTVLHIVSGHQGKNQRELSRVRPWD